VNGHDEHDDQPHDDTGQNHDQSHDQVLDGLVARADLDGLQHLVETRCAAHDWAGVLRIRSRSRAVGKGGRLLATAASSAEYRLALGAPVEWAARVIDEDSGRLAIGPLSEVVAQHHTFADLWPHLPGGPRAGVVAHERVLRGEIIDPAVIDMMANVLELPFELQPWEPDYLLAEYGDHDVTAPSPDAIPPRSFTSVRLPSSVEPLDRDDLFPVREAVRRLLETWTAGPKSRATVVGVDGGPGDALRALGVASARVAPISPAGALAWLAWAGASGGATGRRRGAAAGRFGAWWTAAAIVGLDHGGDDTLADLADDLAEMLAAWQWWWFDTGEPDLGWSLQLVAHHPEDDVAFALSARDAP
jgi:hypothetical protein